ncbi:hypothetical protein ACN28I_40535 [Archangium gephyra]|uniref:hypothetical protein n=1 Tax=Archangium gephyra TaxID=48 RepID=UPI003B807F97
MKCFRYSFLSDGPSDRVLMPAIDWLLRRHSRHAFAGEWAELRRLPRPPRGLVERIKICLDLYPCELLFVHRDAESATHSERVAEIRRALEAVEAPPTVCVVPVRMQEAWLLFNEVALREAADNPNGGERIQLPALSSLEEVLDPKEVLHELLKKVSGRSGRRLKSFDARERIYRLAQILSDYSPLLQVPAFRALDVEVQKTIRENGWV